MSVFVKKMKMPENCYDCSSFGLNVGLTMFDGICPFCMEIIKDYDMKTGRHPDCPLVALPDKHGRLIDADALNLEYEVEMADDWKTAHEIANCVKYAPTIIEAEE